MNDQRHSYPEAIEILKKGNERFINNRQKEYTLLDQVKATAQGQEPFAVVLSCIDSRVPVEVIFDLGIGDIFSIRIAGNVVNDDVLASIEFACAVTGVPLILVLGHTRCGAIKGAMDNIELGVLTKLLDKIQPAVKQVGTGVMKDIAIANVRQSMKLIEQGSDVISNLLAAKETSMIGGMYDVATGKVHFLDKGK